MHFVFFQILDGRHQKRCFPLVRISVLFIGCVKENTGTSTNQKVDRATRIGLITSGSPRVTDSMLTLDYNSRQSSRQRGVSAAARCPVDSY